MCISLVSAVVMSTRQADGMGILKAFIYLFIYYLQCSRLEAWWCASLTAWVSLSSVHFYFHYYWKHRELLVAKTAVFMIESAGFLEVRLAESKSRTEN